MSFFFQKPPPRVLKENLQVHHRHHNRRVTGEPERSELNLYLNGGFISEFIRPKSATEEPPLLCNKFPSTLDSCFVRRLSCCPCPPPPKMVGWRCPPLYYWSLDDIIKKQFKEVLIFQTSTASSPWTRPPTNGQASSIAGGGG